MGGGRGEAGWGRRQWAGQEGNLLLAPPARACHRGGGGAMGTLQFHSSPVTLSPRRPRRLRRPSLGPPGDSCSGRCRGRSGTLQSGGRQVQTVRGRGFPRQPPAPPPRSHTLPRSAPLPARPAPRRPRAPRGPDCAPPRTPGFCEHHPLPVSLVLTRSRVTFPQLLPLHLTNLTARLLQISFYYGPASQSN